MRFHCTQAMLKLDHPEPQAVKKLGAKLVGEHASCGMADDRADKTEPVPAAVAVEQAVGEKRDASPVRDEDKQSGAAVPSPPRRRPREAQSLARDRLRSALKDTRCELEQWKESCLALLQSAHVDESPRCLVLGAVRQMSTADGRSIALTMQRDDDTAALAKLEGDLLDASATLAEQQAVEANLRSDLAIVEAAKCILAAGQKKNLGLLLWYFA